MPLTHIDPRYLDAVWQTVAPMLAESVVVNRGEEDLSQLRARIAFGGSELLVWESDDGVQGVATVEWKQYPNYRVAFVSNMAGHQTAEALPELCAWAKQHGASKLECMCHGARARLYRQRGFTEDYSVMRYKL